MRSIIAIVVLLLAVSGVAYSAPTKYAPPADTFFLSANKTFISDGRTQMAADSAVVIMPDTTFAATTTAGGSAYRIIVGSLLDPATCWDYARFRSRQGARGSR